MTDTAPKVYDLDATVALARRAVAEQGESYVFQGYRTFDSDPSIAYGGIDRNICFYRHADGKPGCLVGVILGYAELLEHIPATGCDNYNSPNFVNFAALCTQVPQIRAAFTDDARLFLRTAQRFQDNKQPWGVAVREAEYATRNRLTNDRALREVSGVELDTWTPAQWKHVGFTPVGADPIEMSPSYGLSFDPSFTKHTQYAQHAQHATFTTSNPSQVVSFNVHDVYIGPSASEYYAGANAVIGKDVDEFLAKLYKKSTVETPVPEEKIDNKQLVTV